jgi:hypothetical protein
MRAVLRRTGADGVLHAPVLRVGQLELEVEHRTLRKAGREIHRFLEVRDMEVESEGSFLIRHLRPCVALHQASDQKAAGATNDTSLIPDCSRRRVSLV